MRTNRLIFMVFLAFIFGTSHAETAPGFFNGSVDDLLKTAKSQNKIIMVDFFTDWCGPCKMLDAQVYQNEKFLPYTKKLVAYKIDAEKGEGVDFAATYKVKSYPTVVFMDGDGVEVKRIIGFYNYDWFVKQVDDILSGKDLPEGWKKDFSEASSYDAALKLATYYMDFDPEAGAPYYQFVLKADPEFKNPETVELYGNDLMRNNLYGQNPDFEKIKAFIQDFPESATGLRMAYTVSMITIRQQQKPDEGYAYFKSVMDKVPESLKPMAFSMFDNIKESAGKSTKEEDMAMIEKMDMTDANQLMIALPKLVKWGETERAEKIAREWVNNHSENADLLNLNNLAWTCFEQKLAMEAYKVALIKKWEAANSEDQIGVYADTIANLCAETGDKDGAVKYGKLAMELETNEEFKAEFEANLKKYQALPD